MGNPDCGDDAAGLLVARGLAERGFKALQHTGDPLDLLELWKNAGYVLLVDAVVSGDAAPGTVFMWKVIDIPARQDAFRSSTHGFGLAEAIALAMALGRLPHNLTVCGIESAEFVAGTPPCAGVLTGIELAIDAIAVSLGHAD